MVVITLTQEERDEKGRDLAFAIGKAIERGCKVEGFDAPNISGGFDGPVTMKLEIEVQPDTELINEVREVLW